MMADTVFTSSIQEEIRKHLNWLHKETRELHEVLEIIHVKNKNYHLNQQMFSSIPDDIQQLSYDNVPTTRRQELRRHLDNADAEMLRVIQELTKKRRTMLSELELTHHKVTEDARGFFVRKQQLAGNGAPFDFTTAADELQGWYRELESIILQNRKQIVREKELCSHRPINILQGMTNPDPLPKLDDLLRSVFQRSLLIEQQPPQIVKKESKFPSSVTLRLLLDGKLNPRFALPNVKTIIISEQQACDVLNERPVQPDHGRVSDGEGVMGYHNSRVVLKFRKMSIEHLNRPTGNGRLRQKVAEKKMCLLFMTEIKIEDFAQPIQINTMSLPIVVTVHGNQDYDMVATITWDNQFALPKRVPFEVRDIVPWSDVAVMLSMRFFGWTGMGLDNSCLNFLADRLFDTEQSRSEVSWSRFFKGKVAGFEFTFWKWFWYAGKLVKESLQDLWQGKLIVGFIDKEECSSKLMSKPVGTFMLRFSGSNLGRISIAWVRENPEKPGGKEVAHLEPFTSSDLCVRKLADRIHDLNNLQFLYPDHKKDEVFGNFYTAVESYPVGGYTPFSIINVIPGEQSTPMELDDIEIHPDALLDFGPFQYH